MKNSNFSNHEKYYLLRNNETLQKWTVLWDNVRKIFGQEAKLHGLLLSSSLLNVKLQATIKLSFNRVTFPKAHSSLVSFSLPLCFTFPTDPIIYMLFIRKVHVNPDWCEKCWISKTSCRTRNHLDHCKISHYQIDIDDYKKFLLKRIFFS